jgi:glycosyltransferase involved in cell wall biosynthesis
MDKSEDKKNGISVLIPVYNSEQTLEELTSRLAEALPCCADHYEIVYIDDGSQDHSWEIISRIADKHPWVRGIRLNRNYGQHNALLCGIREAQYELIVTLDDDLQNSPEDIPRLLKELDGGYDVVYGIPRVNRRSPGRNFITWIAKLALQRAMGIQIARRISAFRAFRTSLRDAFANYHNSYVSIDVLLSWGTTRFSAIPVLHDARREGASGYSLGKLIVFTMNIITGFSTWPLHLASVVGFFFTLFGMAVLVFVVGRNIIQGGGVPGFPFLASVIAIFSGAQLFSLGIMGEYLARMYSRLMERPSYIIQDRRRSESPETNGNKQVI